MMDSSNIEKDPGAVLSHFGSFSGDSFVSQRRSRRSCSSLQSNRIERLAVDLNQIYQSNLVLNSIKDLKIQPQSRCNKSFHHFRFVVAMLAGMSVGLMMFLRYSMTIAILRMVNHTHEHLDRDNLRNNSVFIKHQDDVDEEKLTVDGRFDWNNEVSTHDYKCKTFSLLF